MNVDEFDWVTFDDDEEVIWSGEPMVLSIVKSMIILGIITAIAIAVDPVYGVLVFIASTIISAVMYARVKNTDYVLTNKRLYRKIGTLSEKTVSAPVSKIQNTSLSKDILGTKFGYGNVAITTAASTGTIRIYSIPDPTEFKELLNTTQRNTSSRQSVDGVAQATGDVSLDEVADEIEKFRENVEQLNRKFGGRQ